MPKKRLAFIEWEDGSVEARYLMTGKYGEMTSVEKRKTTGWKKLFWADTLPKDRIKQIINESV